MVSDHSVRRKYRCPQPRCRRIFFARRSVSQHLRTGQCHGWQRTAGLDFSEDSSSDGLTDRDEVEARSYCFRRSHAGATSQSSCRSRRESLVEPCVADSYDERHPRESSTFGCGRDIFKRIRLSDTYSEVRSQNRFYPFSSKKDWEMASWLSRSGLSGAEVNEYLRLNRVCQLLSVQLSLVLITTSRVIIPFAARRSCAVASKFFLRHRSGCPAKYQSQVDRRKTH